MYSLAKAAYSHIKAWPLLGTFCTASKPFAKKLLSASSKTSPTKVDFKNDLLITPKIIHNAELLRHTLVKHSVGFFDFGCSYGGGTAAVQRVTGWIGLGFDLDMRKLKLAVENEILCSNSDILDIPDEPFVSFVIMFHFLEHLYSRTEAYAFIDKACRVCRDNVFITVPFFDADQLLFTDGFKNYYSHWRGHRNSITTTDFYHHLYKLRAQRVISDFLIGYSNPILSSDHENIHPLDSPIDSLKYDPAKHPPKKPSFRFSYDVFSGTSVVIDISGKGYGDFSKICPVDRIAYNTRCA